VFRDGTICAAAPLSAHVFPMSSTVTAHTLPSSRFSCRHGRACRRAGSVGGGNSLRDVQHERADPSPGTLLHVFILGDRVPARHLTFQVLASSTIDESLEEQGALCGAENARRHLGNTAGRRPGCTWFLGGERCCSGRKRALKNSVASVHHKRLTPGPAAAAARRRRPCGTARCWPSAWRTVPSTTTTSRRAQR